MLEVNTISEVISYMLTILGGGMVDLYKFSSSPIKPCLSSREKRGINYVNYVGERLEGVFFFKYHSSPIFTRFYAGCSRPDRRCLMHYNASHCTQSTSDINMFLQRC